MRVPILKSVYWAVTGRLSARLDEIERADRLRASGVFDEARYLASDPLLAQRGLDPVLHYLQSGAREGRSGCPLFDPDWYVATYAVPDHVDPLCHYVETGDALGHAPHPLFDPAFYQGRHPELPPRGGARLAHFLRVGGPGGEDPHALFSTTHYVAQVPPIAEGRIPLLHYLECDALHHRTVSTHPLFDLDWYARYEVDEDENPLLFYLEHGERMGHYPNPLFDPGYYLETNPDLHGWPGHLLEHFVVWGAGESRSPCALFQLGWYCSEHPEVDASPLDPVTHYLREGDAQDFWPHRLFDPRFYGAQHPELPREGGARVVHYIGSPPLDASDPHPLFSTRFYASQSPVLAHASQSLLDHYERTGEAIDLQPNALFDPAFYRRSNPALGGIAQSLLSHYDAFGSRESRWPNPLFDLEFYREQRPDAAEPLADYLHDGARDGVAPHPLFSPSWVREQVPQAPIGQELADFLRDGATDGRDPHPLFDSRWYAERHGLDACELPILHYLDEGAGRGLAPNPHFDPAHYARAVLREAGQGAAPLRPGENPLAHFARTGHAAGLRPGPLFDFCVQFFRQADAALRSPAHNPLAGLLAPPYAELSCAEAELEIDLPQCAEPEVSVVIPAFGPVVQTLACLRALGRAECDISFEVLLVDDDPAQHRDHGSIPHLTILRNEENLGFVHSCNRGAAAARGRKLVFLNNDTLVMDGWLDALVATFDEFGDAGIVGSRLLYPDGSLQEAGGIVFRDASAANFGHGQDPDGLDHGFAREVDYVSAASLMIDAELFRSLGGFDEAYAPAFYEDTDLAFRARALGRRVVYQPASTVVHFGGASYGLDPKRGLKRHQEKNRIVFQERFAAALEGHGAPGASPRRESLRQAAGQVLVMDATTLTPDRDSGSLRMFNLLRVLRRMGIVPTFMPSDMSARAPYVEDLQRIGVRVAAPPAIASNERFLEEWGGQFDLCLLSRPVVAAKWLEAVKLLCPRAVVLYDMVDLHYLRREREIDVLGTSRVPSDEVEAELRACRRADGVIAVSEVDREHAAELGLGTPLHMVSNIHEVHDSATPWSERSDLLFIGGFHHAPNRDAVLWFAQDVLPRIRRALPDVRFRVVGSETPDEIFALASDAILVQGYVEDVAPLLASHRVSVAPLRYGSGVKGKVNQSMSHGLPCVATPIAAEGMEAEAGRDLLVAATAEGFAEAVVALYQDESRWNDISRNGVRSLERTFGMAKAEADLRAIFDHYGIALGR